MIKTTVDDRLIQVAIEKMDQHQIAFTRRNRHSHVADSHRHLAQLQVLMLEPHVHLVIVVIVLRLVCKDGGDDAQQRGALACHFLLHNALDQGKELITHVMLSAIRMSVTKPCSESKR